MHEFSLAESLRIRVRPEQLAVDKLNWLTSLLQQHRGSCPISLDYQNDQAVALLKFGNEWQIKPADQLNSMVRDQFGKENVYLNYR